MQVNQESKVLSTAELAELGLYEEEPQEKLKEIEHRGVDSIGYDVEKLRVGDVVNCYYNKFWITFIIRKINKKSFTCNRIYEKNIETRENINNTIKTTIKTTRIIKDDTQDTVLKNKRFVYIENFDFNRIEEKVIFGCNLDMTLDYGRYW
jgi:hypothetical protein